MVPFWLYRTKQKATYKYSVQKVWVLEMLRNRAATGVDNIDYWLKSQQSVKKKKWGKNQ